MHRTALTVPLLLLSLAGCASMPAASTEPPPEPVTAEQLFLDRIDGHGIVIRPTDQQIETGPEHTLRRARAVCAQFDNGNTWGGTNRIYSTSDGLPERDAALFIITSVSEFCPEHLDQIPA